MLKGFFPTTYSVLSAPALQEHVLSAYALGTIRSCRLWNRGVNDTYFVQTENEKHVLRVYCPGLHAQEHVLFEIDARNHLSQKGVPVAAPLAKNDGSFLTSLNAAEGERYAVLFQYAPGGRFQRPSVAPEIYTYGRTIAQIHNGWNDFRSVHTGHQFSLDYFLERPLKTFLPVLDHRPDEVTYLLELVEDLKKRFAGLPPDTLAYGVCHGDTHGGNANITSDHRVTFYDFEFVGLGWQIYDLATFYWSLQLHKENEALWGTLLEGYTSQRSISELDLKAIPLFIVLRHLFLLGLHSRCRDAWGDNAMNDKYLDFHLAFLRKCTDKLWHF